MSLVYEDPAVNGPQTHVLIIGVGRYSHLKDNAAQNPPFLTSLGQLTSPPVSARNLADWFTNPANRNPNAPVASVELLISDSADQKYKPHGKPSRKIEAATMANIQKGFGEWYKRCDKHTGNIAIFYFCGHGLEKEDVILLPEDFASYEFNRWVSAINFSKTYRGMSESNAATQYFIVDACRQWSTATLKELDMTSAPALKSFTIGEQKPRTAPKLFATASGLPAFGEQNGVSRLTTALLKCLNGGAAELKDKRWHITTHSLGTAVQKLITAENIDLDEKDKQMVDPGGGEMVAGILNLHTFPEAFKPKVNVSFVCNPKAATVEGKFYYTTEGGQVDAETNGLWSQELDPGTYDFGVQFPPGSYKSVVKTRETVSLPIFEVKLEVE